MWFCVTVVADRLLLLLLLCHWVIYHPPRGRKMRERVPRARQREDLFTIIRLYCCHLSSLAVQGSVPRPAPRTLFLHVSTPKSQDVIERCPRESVATAVYQLITAGHLQFSRTNGYENTHRKKKPPRTRRAIVFY